KLRCPHGKDSASSRDKLRICRLTNVRDFPVPRHASAKIEVCVHFQPTRKGEVMNNVTTIGIDLAKNSFSVHGVDSAGAVVLRKTVSRARLMGLLIEQPPCVIGLEACSGAHEWARRLQRFGHTVKLMA